MTWKEFKEEVDRQMAEKGISEDEEIWYIDVGGSTCWVGVGLDVRHLTNTRPKQVVAT